MKLSFKWLGLTSVAFIAWLGLVVLFTALFVDTESNELLAFSGFLLFFGAVTLGFSIGVARMGLPSWIRSIRSQLFLTSVIVAVLVVVNVGFISYLMLISLHDFCIITVDDNPKLLFSGKT